MEIIGTNTAKDHDSSTERWNWLLSSLVLDDMFVHEILMIMDKKADSKVETMGVCMHESRIQLRYNPKFVDMLTDAEVRFVLKHETLHVVLHHITTRLSEDPKERQLWNIAADLAINCLISDNGACTPPKRTDPKTGKVTLNCQFPKEYGFPEKLSMEQYVQLLREKFGKNPPQQGKPQKGAQGQQQNQGGGQGEPDPNGKPQKGEGQGGQGEDQEGKGQGGQGEEGDDPFASGNIDSHDGWNESEIGDELIRQKIEQMASNSQSWGTMSSDTKEMIIAAQQAKVPWTKLLRHYLGHIVTSNYTSTFKRPNKRFGYPFCGRKRTHTDRKLVGIDTSGSVSAGALSQFLSEINRLAEFQPVDVALFDADITQMPKPFDKKRGSYEFTGRGGTDFSPICKLAEQKRYQSLIILTDGYAPAPERPQYVKDVLWVLCEGGKSPVEWGTSVTIEEDKTVTGKKSR